MLPQTYLLWVLIQRTENDAEHRLLNLPCLLALLQGVDVNYDPTPVSTTSQKEKPQILIPSNQQYPTESRLFAEWLDG